MQDAVYHVTLKSHFISDIFNPSITILPLENALFLWTATHNVTKLFAYLIH